MLGKWGIASQAARNFTIILFCFFLDNGQFLIGRTASLLDFNLVALSLHCLLIRLSLGLCDSQSLLLGLNGLHRFIPLFLVVAMAHASVDLGAHVTKEE